MGDICQKLVPLHNPTSTRATHRDRIICLRPFLSVPVLADGPVIVMSEIRMQCRMNTIAYVSLPSVTG